MVSVRSCFCPKVHGLIRINQGHKDRDSERANSLNFHHTLPVELHELGQGACIRGHF